MTEGSSREIVAFTTPDEFAAWLEEHESHRGIWLKLARQGGPGVSPSYAEALDVALCFGWIDGQKAAHDEEYWLQRFTPRTARSRWSQINRERAQALAAAGRMRPAGQLQIERAQADGRWEAAYAGQRGAATPDDLQAELDRDPEIAAAFAALDARNRYAIIWRVNDATRAETRARRIATFVEMLRRGERLHP